MMDEEERRRAQAEQDAHGATPPHGDPLVDAHPQTAGPHERGAPSDEDDTATPPHGDPLR